MCYDAMWCPVMLYVTAVCYVRWRKTCYSTMQALALTLTLIITLPGTTPTLALGLIFWLNQSHGSGLCAGSITAMDL